MSSEWLRAKRGSCKCRGGGSRARGASPPAHREEQGGPCTRQHGGHGIKVPECMHCEEQGFAEAPQEEEMEEGGSGVDWVSPQMPARTPTIPRLTDPGGGLSSQSLSPRGGGSGETQNGHFALKKAQKFSPVPLAPGSGGTPLRGGGAPAPKSVSHFKKKQITQALP